MANTVRLKRTASPGVTPAPSQLELGEIGINTYDGKMYIKKDDGVQTIIEVGTGIDSPLFGFSLRVQNNLAPQDSVSLQAGAVGTTVNLTSEGGAADTLGLRLLSRSSVAARSAGTIASSRARGAVFAEEPVLNNDTLFSITANGYNGTSYRFTSSIDIMAAEDFNGIASGSKMRFTTNAVGTNVNTQVLELGHNGTFRYAMLGTTAAGVRFQYQGNSVNNRPIFQANSGTSTVVLNRAPGSSASDFAGTRYDSSSVTSDMNVMIVGASNQNTGTGAFRIQTGRVVGNVFGQSPDPIVFSSFVAPTTVYATINAADVSAEPTDVVRRSELTGGTAGQVLTSDGAGGFPTWTAPAGPVHVIMGTPLATTTSFANIAGLSFTAAPNKTYKVSFIGTFNGSTGNGAPYLAFVVPGTSTVFGGSIFQGAISSQSMMVQQFASGTTDAEAPSINGINIELPVRGEWLITADATGGTVQLDAAVRTGTGNILTGVMSYEVLN